MSVAPEADASVTGGSAAPPAVGRITFREVSRSALRALIDLDFSFARTARGMAPRPGATARHYIGGERARYTNPVKFALLTGTAYVLVAALTHDSDLAALFDPVSAFGPVWPYLLAVLLLPGAFVQRWLFGGSRFNAAECYTFGLLVLGELTIAATLVELIQAGLGRAAHAGVWIALAGAYTVWSIGDLYEVRRVGGWLRAAAVYVTVVALLAAASWAILMYRFSALAG